eukprot:TRINITY_DN13290_c0_g1_i1.p1 TRINITY_DN13290_c0_g1~~TRINITY_DN13290_c0_g1_i1.p1  ORF type:complete len:1252 (-),score=398.39 TRINITY_DN13290_c0_g1_i1:119-3832(-)
MATAGAADGRRTVFKIEKIVAENFKSYAGVQEIGPFHKRFTSVVGPNGSGKSNVIDSLMFVFGKRATQMRLKKLTELIHKSEQFPNLDFCRVAVHCHDIYFTEGDEEEMVPGSELVIEHKVTLQGSKSTYRINGKNATHDDIASLFLSKGMDLSNNRFLILQGEVESISQMKPKRPNEHEDGLLEFLEDIIGTYTYVERIEALNKEVETMTEERSAKLSRTKAAEREKDNLESAKNEAEAYNSKKRESEHKNFCLYQCYASECDAKTVKAAQKLEQQTSALTAEQAKMKDAQAKLDSNDGYKGKMAQVDAQKEIIQSKTAALTKAQRRDVQILEASKHAESKIKKAQSTISKEQSKRGEASQQLKSHEQDIAKLQAAIAKLETDQKRETAKLEAIIDELKDETAPLHLKVDEAQKVLLPVRKQLTEFDNRMGVWNAEERLLVERTTQGKRDFEQAQQNVTTKQAQLAEKEDKLKTLKARQVTFHKEKKAAEERVAHADRFLNEKTEGLRASRSKLEEGRAARSSASQSQALRLLTENKKQLPGFVGRLGDLGRIDSKYDIAISTACPQLDSIVVETIECAHACVDLLKQREGGRATFICLDKIEEKMRPLATAKVDTPDAAPRLFDLVTPKNAKYATAFYFVLRDTLVANDLDSATKLAFQQKKRWRVVALDGKVVEPSGTMSGGGQQVAKGGMSASTAEPVSEKELAAIAKEVERTQEEVRQARAERQTLDTTLEDLQKEMAQLTTEMRMVEMDVQAHQADLQEQQARVVQLQKTVKPSDADLARIAELHKLMSAEEKSVASTRQKCQDIESNIASLQKQIADIGGTRFKAQKFKVEDLQRQLDDACRSITKMEVSIETCRKTVTKAEKVIASTEGDIAKLEEEKQQLISERAELEEQAGAMLTDMATAEAMLQQLQDELATEAEAYDKLRKVINKSKTKEVELVNAVDDCKRTVTELQAKMAHWNKKISELRKLSEDADALPVLSEVELEEFDTERVQHEIALLEETLANMKPNLAAIEEYRKKEAEYRERLAELDAITEKRDGVRRLYDELRKKRLDEFMAGFSVITMKLKEMYQMITLGGDAELELVDSLDPFSEGIVFSVRPPKKSWKNISNLSGGEKTLSSLALIFALHHYKPTPLYVMDEIDAALDFKNVSIVANYIKERTRDAQFIVISLRNNMFELADRLVGIYKTHNQTKSITIDPSAFAVPTAPLKAVAGPAPALLAAATEVSLKC